MKQLVNVLYEDILEQIESRQSNIMRIEGIDNPVIYQNICRKLDGSSRIDEFIPKITKEKFEASSECVSR